MIMRRAFSTGSSIVVSTCKNNVATIRMNDPKKLNGWTEIMTNSLFKKMNDADQDDNVKVIIITGTDPYYCAGVNLSGTLKPMHPKKLKHAITERNEALFNNFLNLKKPIIAAINGPAIGACVTSATLCDAIIASDKAKFLTPFGRLGVTPEGCSSVHFEYLIGKQAADRMLHEDWEPTATEAKALGLITDVVPHAELLDKTQALAEKWIQEGKHLQPRTAMGYEDIERLKAVNAVESIALGEAFLADKFIRAQANFLQSKGKTSMALAFRAVLFTRPLWSRLL